MRNPVLAVLLALGSLAPVAAQSPPRAPHSVLGPVGIGDVRWTTGFWADRFATCRKESIPHLQRVMMGTEYSQYYHNFLIAAGKEKGRHRGASFNDGDFYKWLEAVAAVYAVTKDRDLDRLMDEAITTISQAQRADGYLHTPVLIRQRNGETDAQPLQERLHFETYNLGHLLTAACVHHRATGKSNFLKVAIKAGDYLHATFKDPTPRLARNAICPSHYMGIVDLYRTTKDPKYLELAKKFIDMRDLVEDGSDDNQDRIPFRKQTQAVGHAVRANYLYAGAADVYAETGDRTLLEPLRKIWENVVSTKTYITGGCGSLYDGASPDGSKEQKQIGRVHQAYGREYQLPNSTAHNETCASVASVLWNWRMLQITGDARFADALERVLYNAALAGISLDGRSFFYTNTLRQLDSMPVELRWSRMRQPFISSFCCPPNLVRIIAEVSGYVYGVSESGVWVNLYGSSVLETRLHDGARFKLTQETDYPWDGRVKITIDATPSPLPSPPSKGGEGKGEGVESSVKLRIPGWTKNATLSINGTAERKPLEPGTYFEARRVWSKGDVLELNLPMRAQLLQAHPLVEETRNQVAVQRGPLVYCLESLDLPKGVTVSDVVIPRGIEMKPRHDPRLLGGITVLEGKADAITEPAWHRELYRELTPATVRPIEVSLIPYHAWSNRGKSEMTVWLPLGPASRER